MKRVLLLEDDHSLGATLNERLSKHGYQVVWSSTLADARSQFSKGSFDLAIVDISLPDGNGFEFAQFMRRTSKVPFLFLTALSSAEYRLKGYEIGASEFIPKPFHLRELFLRIERLLGAVSIPVPAIVELQGVKIDFDRLTVTHADGTMLTVAAKDLAILRLLIDRAPAVVSRDEILKEVWQSEPKESATTRGIDNCMVRLRHLLDPNTTHSKDYYIRSIRGIGYQWNAVDEKPIK